MLDELELIALAEQRLEDEGKSFTTGCSHVVDCEGGEKLVIIRSAQTVAGVFSWDGKRLVRA